VALDSAPDLRSCCTHRCIRGKIAVTASVGAWERGVLQQLGASLLSTGAVDNLAPQAGYTLPLPAVILRSLCIGKACNRFKIALFHQVYPFHPPEKASLNQFGEQLG